MKKRNQSQTVWTVKDIIDVAVLIAFVVVSIGLAVFSIKSLILYTKGTQHNGLAEKAQEHNDVGYYLLLDGLGDVPERINWSDETPFESYGADYTGLQFPEIKNTAGNMAAEDEVKRAYAALPENVRDYLVNKHWTIEIQEDYVEGDETAFVAGQTRHNERTIVLCAGMDNIDRIFVHEVGHVVAKNIDMFLAADGYESRQDYPDVYFHDANRWYSEMSSEYLAEYFAEWVFYAKNAESSGEDFYDSYTDAMKLFGKPYFVQVMLA